MGMHVEWSTRASQRKLFAFISSNIVPSHLSMYFLIAWLLSIHMVHDLVSLVMTILCVTVI